MLMLSPLEEELLLILALPSTEPICAAMLPPLLMESGSETPLDEEDGLVFKLAVDGAEVAAPAKEEEPPSKKSAGRPPALALEFELAVELDDRAA